MAARERPLTADERIRERDIVEILSDLGGVDAGTQGTVILDWSDGTYEVAANGRPVPVTVGAPDLALLARPVGDDRAP